MFISYSLSAAAGFKKWSTAQLRQEIDTPAAGGEAAVPTDPQSAVNGDASVPGLCADGI
jgi:hypothetical protein